MQLTYRLVSNAIKKFFLLNNLLGLGYTRVTHRFDCYMQSGLAEDNVVTAEGRRRPRPTVFIFIL